MTTDAMTSSPSGLRRPTPDQQTPRPTRGGAAHGWRAWPWREALKHVFLGLLCLTMLYPLLWMLGSSFKPADTIFRQLGLWPQEWTIENYPTGWEALGHPFSLFLWNSLVIAIGAIIGNLVACSLTAYAFARMHFRGRNVMFAVMLLTLMLPFQVTLVPQYIVFARFFEWTNTFYPMIVPKFLATDAFFVFLMVQFIRGIPRELDEAARIDGAGHFRIYYRIVLPLMMPALATTAIFTFIWSWNDFFSQLLYLTSEENMTASLAVKYFLDSEGFSNYGAMFAMSLISLAPLFFIFLGGQRFLLRGIATTGIK